MKKRKSKQGSERTPGPGSSAAECGAYCHLLTPGSIHPLLECLIGLKSGFLREAMLQQLIRGLIVAQESIALDIKRA